MIYKIIQALFLFQFRELKYDPNNPLIGVAFACLIVVEGIMLSYLFNRK
jgi:hypothetical protein